MRVIRTHLCRHRLPPEVAVGYCPKVGCALFGCDFNGDWQLAWRHAFIDVARLVTHDALPWMGAAGGDDVGFQDEVAGVDVELLIGREGKGSISAGREIDGLCAQAVAVNDGQAGGDQVCVVRGVRVDVQAVGYDKVQGDDAGFTSGEGDLDWIEELHCVVDLSCFAGFICLSFAVCLPR